MRYLFGFMCVCALGAMPLVGCDAASGEGPTGGSAGAGGTGGAGLACEGGVCPCSEAGIRAAISEGGGLFTFDCDSLTTVVTESEIVIDNYVVLDGEGKLTVDGSGDHRVFSVSEGVTAELADLVVTGGSSPAGGGILNLGTLTLTNSIVSGNRAFDAGGGIANNPGATMAIANTTVTGNTASEGGGVHNWGILTMTGVLVSENSVAPGGSEGEGGGLANWGTLVVTNSTVSGNEATDGGGGIFNAKRVLVLVNTTVSRNSSNSGADAVFVLGGSVVLTNTIIDGNCEGAVTSDGYNVESPGDTCGLDTNKGDQIDVAEGQLTLGPLQDNGGPTETHALRSGSVAIDVIPESACEVDTDQRGERRPEAPFSMCDVGAFEVHACESNVCPCGEAGIRAAIEAGGEEPYTFDCDGPRTVQTNSEITIYNDVILDGEGNLTVDGDGDHRVFSVGEDLTVALRGLVVTGGMTDEGGGGILNQGSLEVTNSAVSGNFASGNGGGIDNHARLTLTNSTVSENRGGSGGGIYVGHTGTLTATNSTLSGNTTLSCGGGVDVDGVVTLMNCTVSENTADDCGGGIFNQGSIVLSNSLVSGNSGDDCQGQVNSNGYNIESPGNTCDLDQVTDQVDVSAAELNLGPLANNGGPTMTHALGEGSVAVDVIPAVECVDADGEPLTTDQRGVTRPGGTMCDVGAFEVQP